MRPVAQSSASAPVSGSSAGSDGPPSCTEAAVLQSLQWGHLGAFDALIDRSGEADEGWTLHTLSRSLVNWPTDVDRALVGLSCEVNSDADARAGAAVDLDPHEIRLIGIAGVVPDPRELRGAHLAVLVDPHCRRRGFGTQLVEAIVRIAIARGYRSASARADHENAGFGRMMMRLGFSVSSRPGPEPLQYQRVLDGIVP